MNNKETNSIRVLMTTLRNGQPWGSWRGNVRLIDETHVDTTFGQYEVKVDGDTTYFLKNGERKRSIPTSQYGKLLLKNQDKWNGESDDN